METLNIWIKDKQSRGKVFSYELIHLQSPYRLLWEEKQLFLICHIKPQFDRKQKWFFFTLENNFKLLFIKLKH